VCVFFKFKIMGVKDCASGLPTGQLHVQQETAWLLVTKPEGR
jgi:hypothetical protein